MHNNPDSSCENNTGNICAKDQHVQQGLPLIDILKHIINFYQPKTLLYTSTTNKDINALLLKNNTNAFSAQTIKKQDNYPSEKFDLAVCFSTACNSSANDTENYLDIICMHSDTIILPSPENETISSPSSQAYEALSQKLVGKDFLRVFNIELAPILAQCAIFQRVNISANFSPEERTTARKNHQTEATIKSLTASLASTNKKLLSANYAIDNLRDELSFYKTGYISMRNSFSWKITGPIRSFKSKIKKASARAPSTTPSGTNMPVENKPFPGPWQTSFSCRKKYLANAIDGGYKIAVHFYDVADYGPFRYRCYNIMQALENSSSWRSIYFFTSEISELRDSIKYIHLPIFVRTSWTLEIETFATELKASGLPFVFDIDDMIFDLEKHPLVTETLGERQNDIIIYDRWFSLIARQQHAARLADAFTTTNNFLGQSLHKKFGKPYSVIRNFLNEEQLAASVAALNQKQLTKNKSPFTIGYFSGSATHTNDFKSIYKELLAFLLKYPDSRLQIVGYMDLPADMQNLVEIGKIAFAPIASFVKLQSLVAQVDVNIVPLAQNDFTNAKSELKFFEAAVVETVTIATPTSAYEESIKQGETGFLCLPGEWFATLENMYLKKVDSGKIAKAAKEYALEIYTPELQCKNIESVYTSILDNFSK